MNDLAKSVRNVMVVFLFCFIGLISYMAYFQIFKGPGIAEDPKNVRLWAKRNEVLRGTIYDRNGEPLTKSKRVDTLTQDREYLYGDLYVHALGYVDERYGLTGLEEEFDNELSSYNTFSNGIRNLFKDFNLKSAFENRDKEQDKKVGNGLVTTLDYNIQKVAYDALGDRKGSVVALNPKTGEILAMVSKPTYDPANLEQAIKDANAGVDEENKLLNRATNGIYPPGSVFKTITLSSAIENNPSVTGRIFNDTGKITFADGSTLNNYMHQAHGNIDLRRAYRVSSNVVFGTLAMELGNEKLKATAEKFGFNSRIPGVGVSMSISQFPTLESYEEGNIAQSGIGQGSVVVTPMQMAIMAATVANDGVLMEPKLVNKVVDKDGNNVKEIPNKVLKEDVIPKDVAETVKGYMGYLVENNLYRWPAFEGTNAGAKTGTADYKLPDGTDAIPHGWFITAAPLDNPKVAVAVIVENGENGAGTAAEIASQVVRMAVLGE
ncbi:peptidoglycan D,D-transpeptidase FtsI family protein [Clostridium chauvoei]|uniref:Penicillin-binding protein 2 n=2 Tax=Clostridium chauvoei TaxID=46867 RepID=A0ABD4RIX2_9CLOT|nr:penicillin-binding protein 2 [Clostridium chauvoei]ATD54080.1 penicillin-binding protein [Clostridium chauvoei]ATD58469.1 penicillin-binding protein [Clostridium chauvoei]MBX7281288.1 penicillin-binding protein 2 [Clostridium chauvoei]MBX7283806.1 penicillin-binding protein 2 [Clostridium chauvoei]MBX7286377.1 penicillin-binding protein 2 [Clostridium chauvoei]